MPFYAWAYFFLSLWLEFCTVEAPVSGHPQEAEKVPATGAGRLRDCLNTEFVGARVQMGFYQGSHCGFGPFFTRYFGNFTLKVQYCGYLQPSRMRFFSVFLDRTR